MVKPHEREVDEKRPHVHDRPSIGGIGETLKESQRVENPVYKIPGGVVKPGEPRDDSSTLKAPGEHVAEDKRRIDDKTTTQEDIQ